MVEWPLLSITMSPTITQCYLGVTVKRFFGEQHFLHDSLLNNGSVVGTVINFYQYQREMNVGT